MRFLMIKLFNRFFITLFGRFDNDEHDDDDGDDKEKLGGGGDENRRKIEPRKEVHLITIFYSSKVFLALIQQSKAFKRIIHFFPPSLRFLPQKFYQRVRKSNITQQHTFPWNWNWNRIESFSQLNSRTWTIF